MVAVAAVAAAAGSWDDSSGDAVTLGLVADDGATVGEEQHA